MLINRVIWPSQLQWNSPERSARGYLEKVMHWAIHAVGLATRDLERSVHFFGDLVGLGEPKRRDGALWFGEIGRGLRIAKPDEAVSLRDLRLVGDVGTEFVKLGLSDMSGLSGALRDGDGVLWHRDPAGNLVGFEAADARMERVHPWEAARGWGFHHVNLAAHDVRGAIEFYLGLGMAEGRWDAPKDKGDFSIEPDKLAILPLGEGNRGLHLIEPDDGFGQRNGFAHNPSIGGHPAFWVSDLMAVKARLEASGVLVSDAGVYAMPGMHQLYVHDPDSNVIEINGYV